MISQELQTVSPSHVLHSAEILKDFEVGKMSPAQVRQTVAALVAEDKTEVAVALCEASLAIYPNEQDILAVYALLCEIKQDWPMAEQCLVQLIHAQGADSTAQSWLHLVRVLHCQNKWEDAWIAVSFALSKFPEDEMLKQEMQGIQKAIDDLSAELRVQK
jgi:hypothetical protein